MSKDFSRTDRVAALIMRQLSQIIRTEMDDPRVGLVSITAVSVTRDLQHAKIYFSLLDESDAKSVQTTLNKARAFLRRALSQHVQLRFTPELRFYYDDSFQKQQRIDDLLAFARRSSDDTPE